MDQCPTCRAPYREGDVCYRCQTDWRQMLGVERAAVRCQQQAVAALQSKRFHTAYDYAKQACKLHRCSESIRVLALASLGLRKFDDALALWKEYRGVATRRRRNLGSHVPIRSVLSGRARSCERARLQQKEGSRISVT